ncbi:iron complex transport system permease protein [Solimonas aquatica]|uniref:Iron complex transport system permease protein n=1 Tax=Solimonas aquatica TaxID=489703 RepID=A0A1H8ZP31_9GAMM|nr:iron ABC transporter permease [Solimonas aquatica]SEP66276.1 iron complex transport system permease protein [Solimonas aquatica]
MRLPPRALGLVLLLLLLATAAASLLAGAVPLAPGELFDALRGGDAHTELQHTVLLQLRLPRLLNAIGVGGGLALAGCAFQAVLRNPLADPSFIGVSGGAAVAAAAALAGLTALPLLPAQLLVPAAALLGALAAALLVLRLARVDGETQPVTLLLTGLAVNALAGGLLGLIAYASADPTLRVITLWLFGSLSRAGWTEVLIALSGILLAGLLLWRHAAGLNALLLGEAEALHIGVAVRQLKRRSILLAVLASALAVAAAGVIGFVGLMVPHVLRLLVGPDHRALLPLSFLGGALLLSITDLAARLAMQPGELPVGIVTALLGAPFFLALLLRWRHAPELA